MNIILGFGLTEVSEREKIKEAIIRDGADAIKTWNDKADIYDKMPRETAPERYTRVFYYDGIIKYHHINRQHPFSPDGWALLRYEEKIEVSNP